MPYNAAKTENEYGVCKHNIGIPTYPKNINFPTHLSFAQNSYYCTLMKKFTDIFSWENSDLKTYDVDIIHHKIPLEKNTIPFKQKLRPISPLLLPLIEK